MTPRPHASPPGPRPARAPHAHGLHGAATDRILFWPALVCGVGALAMIGADLGPRGFAMGALVAVVPVPFYVLLALWLDRFEAEPPRVLAQTFAWGATVAFLLALLVNSYAEGAMHSLFGSEAARFFGAVVSAPVAEELAKGAALLFLFHELEDEFDGVVDGVVYAAMVGLGFAMVENIQYYGRTLVDGTQGSLDVFVVRGMLSPFAHPFFTSMIGIGLGIVREAPHDARRALPPLAGVAAAVGLHSLWNVAAASEERFYLAYLIVMVPAFLGVLGLIWASLRREGGVVREHLRPLVEEGMLTPEELECLCNVRRRLRASLAAWWDGGRESWARRRAMHQVASELAFHRWRVGRGLSRGERADAAREAEYLRQLLDLARERA